MLNIVLLASLTPAPPTIAGMKRLGVQPNTVSYNSLISACERCGEWERACEVLKQMKLIAQRPGANVRPNSITYNTVLSACGKAGRWDTFCHRKTICCGH